MKNCAVFPEKATELIAPKGAGSYWALTDKCESNLLVHKSGWSLSGGPTAAPGVL